MITRLIWVTWAPMSTVRERPLKLNHSLTLYFSDASIQWDLGQFVIQDMQSSPGRWAHLSGGTRSTKFCILNAFRPRQNVRHFPGNLFSNAFFNENVQISIKVSLKFVPGGPVNNFPALVQIMAWRRPGDKPLSEPMMISLQAHICVTRPQWVIYIYST